MEQLQDLALGLIPGCSDAKKTITGAGSTFIFPFC